MLPGNPGYTSRERNHRRNNPMVHSVLAVCFFKGTSTTSHDADGVSTYLALTFSTLLSSQGTDASFETVSPVSPGASLRCFTRYQTFFRFPNRCLSHGMRKQIRDLDQVAVRCRPHLDEAAADCDASSGWAGVRQYSAPRGGGKSIRGPRASPACAACAESQVPMTYASGQCAVRDRR